MRQNLTRGSLAVERSIDMESCFVVQTATPILHRVPETKVRFLPSRFSESSSDGRAIHENVNHVCDFDSNLFKGENVSVVQIHPLRFSDTYSKYFG